MLEIGTMIVPDGLWANLWVLFARDIQLDSGSCNLWTQNTFKRKNPAFPRKNRAFLDQKLVGAAGFEPATFWSRTKRATKLRYTPRFAFACGELYTSCMQIVKVVFSSVVKEQERACLMTAAAPLQIAPMQFHHAVQSARGRPCSRALQSLAGRSRPPCGVPAPSP